MSKTAQKTRFFGYNFGLCADKRLKNSQKQSQNSKTQKMAPFEDRAAQKTKGSCPRPKR